MALCAFIFLIGYFGVKQEAVFNFARKESITVSREDITNKTNEFSGETPGTEEIIPLISKDKYKHSSLTKEKSFELFEAFKLFMLEKKPYQDSELTLYSLSKQFEIHPNHLSQLINQNCNQNFFDFVNEQRVNDVKEMLLANQYSNLSLLGIAFETGFNSKASFNRAFKKFTGMTPVNSSAIRK
jgi:YesN/AraC family two-component response regulator